MELKDWPSPGIFLSEKQGNCLQANIPPTHIHPFYSLPNPLPPPPPHKPHTTNILTAHLKPTPTIEYFLDPTQYIPDDATRVSPSVPYLDDGHPVTDPAGLARWTGLTLYMTNHTGRADITYDFVIRWTWQ